MTSEPTPASSSLSSESAGWAEWVFHLLLAAGLIAVLFGLVLNRPVLYTRVVAEDNLGEDATFLALTLAAAMLGLVSFRAALTTALAQRLCWLGVGLGAAFIAGEEISWGQRIIGISPPEALRNANLQHELNVHNIAGIQVLDFHKSLAMLLLVWAAGSWLLPESLRARLRGVGLPLAPAHLSPLLLCIPWVVIARPFPKPDEIAELLFGLFMVIWALDLVLRQGRFWWATPLARCSAIALMLAFVAGAAALISIGDPAGGMRGRLNAMGYRDLPKRGLYRQSDLVMAHIYEHPDRYLMPETRLEHAKLLLSLDRADEAREVLMASLAEPSPAGESAGRRAEDYRRRGEALMLLGEPARASTEIDQAIAIRLKLMLSSPENRADHLFSISRSLAVVGRLDGALDRAREASDVVEEAKLRREIERFIRYLEDRVSKR